MQTDNGSDLRERPEDYLRRMGDSRVVVLPGDDELFVDIDSEEDLEVLQMRLQTLRQFMPATVTRTTPSAEEGHYHVVVRLPGDAIDPTTRVALQACLGSDRKRELLSLMRILLKMDRPPTVFFEEAQ